MKSLWQNGAARFDAMKPRERGLIAVAVLAGIVLVAYTAFIEPKLKQARLDVRNVTEQQAALQVPERNPDVRARAELASLNQQLGELAGRFAAIETALVPPQRMSGLLEEMIGRDTGLRLISLKTLPVTPLLDKKAVDAAGGGARNRRRNRTMQRAAYLERLEKSKMKLLWSRVSLSAEDHPKLVMTLTVYSLSLDRTWLIV